MAADGNPSPTWAFETLLPHWRWMLALGILMVVLGMIGLLMAAAFTIASVLVFGALLVVGGIAQVVDALRATGWKSTALHVFIALVYIAAGAIALYDPVAASLSLILFIAAMLTVAGVLRAATALQMRLISLDLEGEPAWAASPAVASAATFVS